MINQVKESFAVKELALALYRALARHLLSMFKEVEISHMPRSSNQYVDALATLGSSFVFDVETSSESMIKRNVPLTHTLLDKSYEVDGKYGRHPILATLPIIIQSYNF